MIKKIKIGIVGCGAIGASLAESLVREFRSQAELSALFDIDPVKSGGLGRRQPEGINRPF